MESYKSPLEDEYREENKTSYHTYNRRYGPTQPHGSNRHAPYRQNQPGPSRHSGHDMSNSYGDRYKTSRYPRSLTNMFGNDECKLCSVPLQSPIVGKMHYAGKNHLKKVKRFLTAWSFKTGLPMPEINDPANEKETSLADYCEICDVTLISINDKVLHYSGKTHQKNERDPANAKKKKKVYETIDLSTRFGIGEQFSNELLKINEDLQSSKNALLCELCDVRTISQDQMSKHIAGKKHQEKLKKQGYDRYDGIDKPFKCKLCDICFETKQLLNIHVKGKKHSKALLKEQMSNNAEGVKNTNCESRPLNIEEKADKMIEELKYWYCIVCKKQYHDNKTYTGHLFEEKHIKLSQANPSMEVDGNLFQCMVCNLPMPENMKEAHFKDRVHLQKSIHKASLQSLVNLANKDLNMTTYNCHNCSTGPLNFVEYSNHILGNDHIEVMIRDTLFHLK